MPKGVTNGNLCAGLRDMVWHSIKFQLPYIYIFGILKVLFLLICSKKDAAISTTTTTSTTTATSSWIYGTRFNYLTSSVSKIWPIMTKHFNWRVLTENF